MLDEPGPVDDPSEIRRGFVSVRWSSRWTGGRIPSAEEQPLGRIRDADRTKDELTPTPLRLVTMLDEGRAPPVRGEPLEMQDAARQIVDDVPTDGRELLTVDIGIHLSGR